MADEKQDGSISGNRDRGIAEKAKENPLATAAILGGVAAAVAGVAVAAGARKGSNESKTSGTTGRRSNSRGGGGKSATARAKQGSFFSPLTPSKELAEITGFDALPRTEVVRKMWAYIKRNKLQNPQNKREILADEKLKLIFGRDAVSMFDMNKLLSKHLR